ncbi:MAG TPA: hypothetical protein VHQ47_09625 [Phycisphaerae bacterium]|nr:hypothetical protein [Phycisphaerae bacterium]
MTSARSSLALSACIAAALAFTLPALAQNSGNGSTANPSADNPPNATVHANPTTQTSNGKDRGMSGNSGITKTGTTSNSNNAGTTTPNRLANVGDSHAAAGNNSANTVTPGNPTTQPTAGMAGGVRSGAAGATASSGSAGSSGNTGSLGSLGIGASGSGMNTGSNASGDQHTASNH